MRKIYTNKLNDICADENVFVTMSGNTPVATYRLETAIFRHIGFSDKIQQGSPLGTVDIGIEITQEIVCSFNATSHKNVHNRLREEFPEYFV